MSDHPAAPFRAWRILGSCVSGRACSRCCSGWRGAGTRLRPGSAYPSRSSAGWTRGLTTGGFVGRSTGGAPEPSGGCRRHAAVTRSGPSRKGVLFLAGVVAVAAVVGAAAGTARAADRNDVRILVQPPSGFDPATQSDAATAAITAQLYETLTAYDAALQLQPALARSWDVAGDGRRVVFHLRAGL